ncbi:MAG: HAD-IB family phosphatase [Bacilli bacterium]|nr:HAD-IB family phosphatase [Bacilli bacterium]
MDKKIDVYDFDGTIYKGDSSIDFMFFALGKNKKIWTLFFKYVWFTVLYMLHRISSSTYKQIFFSFLTKLENVDDLVAEFWKKKQNKIASFFLKEVEKGNSIYVISASPTFLLKPFLSSFSNVSLIATVMDKKTGEIKGENCKGKEKIRRLNKEVGNASIHSFYTDSLHDLPLVKLAEHSFLVTNGVVEPFNEKVLLKRKENKKALGIFFFFLTLYLVLGTLLSYHYDFSKAFDVLFNADSPRVIGDMSDVFANHYRIKVHPLFVLITQPLVLLISGLTIDKTIAIIVLLSIVTATSVTLLYKFASLFVKEDKIKLPMVFLFGFTFSNMVFTAGIELYNIAALFLLALWYHIAKMMKKEKVEKKDLYLLIGFGILTASITITNYVIFLIGSFILWMSKKVSFKKLFLINLVTVLLVIGLSFFQNMVWQNTPVITDFKENYTEEDSYIEKSISMRQIKNVIKGDYIHALVASPLYLEKDQFIDFSKTSILSITLVALFYTVVLGFVIWQYKKHSWLTVGLLLSLLFNTALHIIYGNVCAFLYALHFLYLPFLLFFTHYKEPSKKIKKGLVILLTLLTTATALLNLYRFKQLLYLASTVLTPNYFVTYFSLFFLLLFILCIILLSYFFLFFILRCLKKIVMGNEKIKYGILMIILFALWSCLFIGIQAIPQHEKFLGVRVGTTSLSNVKVYEPNKDLKKAFPKEYASYLTTQKNINRL